jgi:hypothetical protein
VRVSASLVIFGCLAFGQASADAVDRIQPGTSAVSPVTRIQPGTLATSPVATDDFPLATPVEAVESNVVREPLDFRGKTDYFMKAVTSQEAVGRIAFTSALKQLGGSDFGGGIGGFSETYASKYASHLTKRSIQFGIGAVRGEEPRFVRSGKEGFWARTGFVLSRTVLVDMDNGGTSIAMGKLAGSFGSGALSAYWQPGNPDPWKRGLSTLGTSMAGDAAMRMVREFWPEIKSLFKR